MLFLPHLPLCTCRFGSVLRKGCFPDLTSTPRFYYEFPNSSHPICGSCSLLTPPQHEPPEQLQPRKGGTGVDTGYPDTPLAPAQHLYLYLLSHCAAELAVLGKHQCDGRLLPSRKMVRKRSFPKDHCWQHIPAGLGAAPVPLKCTLIYPSPNEPPFPGQLQGSLSDIRWVWITELLPPQIFMMDLPT